MMPTSLSLHHKQLLAGAGVLLILGGLLVWYMATHQAPESYFIAEPTEEQPAPSEPGILEEHGEYYDIRATYPTRTPLTETAGEDANDRAIDSMEGFVRDMATDFKRQGRFDSLTPEDIQIMGLSSTRKENLAITHEEFLAETTLSYTFTIILDTLGAHPNTFYRTFTFDRTTGEELRIGDLFVPNTDYLTRLSATAEFELNRSLGEWADILYIREGVAPDENNFQTFIIADGSLQLLFPPYQVAPYAAGPQRAIVPLSQLADILRPEYRP